MKLIVDLLLLMTPLRFPAECRDQPRTSLEEELAADCWDERRSLEDILLELLFLRALLRSPPAECWEDERRRSLDDEELFVDPPSKSLLEERLEERLDDPLRFLLDDELMEWCEDPRTSLDELLLELLFFMAPLRSPDAEC